MTEQELLTERRLQREARTAIGSDDAARGGFGPACVRAWLAVGIPFLIRLLLALTKVAALFG